MNFDGFLYVFALVGVITTAVSASLGVALTLAMARFAYVRFKVVAPLLFPPLDLTGQPRIAQQQGSAPNDMNEPISKYTEKTRLPAASNDGRKSQAAKEIDAAAAK